MLQLAPGAREAVLEHARAGAPAEVCGVLGGERGPERSVARVVERADNAAASPETRYAIDPAEQLELMERLEATGDEVVGFYHSHPRGPAAPSETDARRATWRGYSYVIVVPGSESSTASAASAADAPQIGAWRWTEGGFEREKVAATGPEEPAGSGLEEDPNR